MLTVPGMPTLGAPAGTQPNLFNPLDPNAWSKLWQVPLQAAPAAEPAK